MNPDVYRDRRRANGQAAALHRRPRKRVGRVIGAVLAGLALVALMALAGAVEDPANGAVADREQAMLESEWRLWRGLTPVDRHYYCSLNRGYARLLWGDAIAEGENWDAPAAMRERVARYVIRRGCN